MAERPLEILEANVATLPQLLNLSVPLPVVVLIGGAGNLDKAKDSRDEQALQATRENIEQVLAEAVLPAVVATSAVVLTGGTNAGVMRMAGEMLGDSTVALVGVVPEAKLIGDQPEAALDPRHTAAVLTSGTRWGSETEVLFELAERLTGGTAPGVVVLANGGTISFEEARRFLRGGWPIVTVSGSGGAAQELMDAVTRSKHESKWGDLKQADVESLSQDGATARRQMLWRLHSDELLKSAWVTFSSYDAKAVNLKESSARSRWLLTTMSSVLLVAITLTVQFAVLGWASIEGAWGSQLGDGWVRSVLAAVLVVARWAVLVLPIAIAVAAALGSFAGSQTKWRNVRASAETLKREIYRYRAHAMLADRHDAEDRLARVLHVVDDEAIRAGVGLAETPPGLVRGRPSNVDLDELEVLSAKVYIKRRLEQQVLWFGSAARRHRRSEWFVVAAGAVAAAVAMSLAETSLAPWVALIVLAATLFTLSRERGASRQQVVGFDRAIADVNDAWVEWLRLTPVQRGQATELAEFVDRVEKAFEREGLSWSEVMRRAAKEPFVPSGLSA